jgi:demethylmenaquinone methyltransferase / 2-methoxy-6-polyprenyl-1,4-benzoquinol methylase
MNEKTHFGFTQVDENQKAGKVASVFSSVAPSYDVMNDVMSAGLHRVWKKFCVDLAAVRFGENVLDVAAGSGDLTLAWAKAAGLGQVQNGKNGGMVWQTDINAAMLGVGRNRLLNAGYSVPALLCDAEKLCFADNTFDVVSVAFGLRNMTHKDQALAEMKRVLKPGGRLLVLEFSKVAQPLQKAYDAYSFKLLPLMGKLIAKDEDSYRYLAESIRMHPDQATLAKMMEDVGLSCVEYFNLTAGVAAVHRGYKI